MSPSLKPSMPWYYNLIGYFVFGGLLFLGGKYVDVFDVNSSLISYSLLGTFFGALLPLPMMGVYNRIKKRPYFYKWSNLFFFASLFLFFVSPLMIWYAIALKTS